MRVSQDARALRGKMDWGKTPIFDLETVKDGDLITIRPYATDNIFRWFGIAALPFKISVT